MSVFNNVAKYLPSDTIRSINKEYKNSIEYCKISSKIYNNDYLSVKNKNNSILYYQEDDLVTAVTIKNNKYVIYKIKQIDDYIQLTIYKSKYFKNDMNDNYIIDIDLLNTHHILVSRGCEDIIKNYSRDNTLKILLNTFKKYFNPDVITDIVYLYTYLHSNCFLLDYEEYKEETKQFKLHKIPKQDFIQKIYDMYNLLYVHFNI